MVYDRDVVVNCVKRHYELLVKAAYFDPAEVLYPPDEGWSDEQLAIDVLRAFRRSEEVIDLLRHLPYIKQLDGDDRDEVYLYTQHLSYLRDARPVKSLDPKFCRRKQLADDLLMPTAGEWPAQYISLTRDQHATWWVIDTAKGIIHVIGTGYIEPPEDEPWLMGSIPRDIQEYFDEIYAVIEALILVPCPIGEKNAVNRTIEPCSWEVGSIVNETLRKHGWPSNWDRDGYVQEVSENLKQTSWPVPDD